MTRTVDSQCDAFQTAIDVLGRPWTALILTTLQAGPLRWCELAEKARGPSEKLLSARLKDLEARGLVARTVEPGPPLKVTYALTRQGRAFHEVAVAIERWGRAILPPSPRRRLRGRSP